MEPSALTRLFQGDLDWIVMKCLEKERGRRYETATALAADVQRHLGSEPVEARPPTATYRLGKAIRRHRMAFVAGTTVTVALLIGLAGTTWQSIRATRAEREQAAERERAVTAASREATAREAAEVARNRAEKSDEHARRLLYAANMNLVQAAWDQNNLPRIQRLLEDTGSSPYRGFEWYYWQKEIRGEAFRLQGHTGGVYTVAVSRDGSRIVTGGTDGTARVWDASTGKLRLTISTAVDTVWSVAFSPDGRRVVTAGSFDSEWEALFASTNKTSPLHRPAPAQIWDSDTGREILRIRGHTGGILAVTFSPDGSRIITGGPVLTIPGAEQEAAAIAWDAQTGQELVVVQDLNAESDGRFSGSMPESGVFGLAYSPDGEKLATVTTGGKITIRNSKQTNIMIALSAEYGKKAMVSNPTVAFSPDGRRLIATGDESAKVWDVTTGAELFTLRAPVRGVTAAAFSPDGRWIATGGVDGTVRVWDTSTGRESRVLKGHGPVVACAVFLPTGNRLVTASADESDAGPRVWEWESTWSREFMTAVSASSQAHLVSEGERLITVETNGTTRLWSTVGGTLEDSWRLEQNEGFVKLLPDRQRMLTISTNLVLRLRAVVTGEMLGSPFDLGTTTIVGDTLCNGDYVAVYDRDHLRLHIRRMTTGAQAQSMILRLDGLSLLALSPDGKRVVIASNLPGSTTAEVRELSDEARRVPLVGHQAAVWIAGFSPDGSNVVTVGYDRTAMVWKTTSGQEVFRLAEHPDTIQGASFSNDGGRLVTFCLDGVVRVWDASNGMELLTLPGLVDQSRRWLVSFSHTGERILASSFPMLETRSSEASGAFRIWESATPAQVSRWQEADREHAQRLAARMRAKAIREESRPKADEGPTETGYAN